MSFLKTGRLFQASLLLASALVLAACGFHLRGQGAILPPSMQRVHITGDFNLQNRLAHALRSSGVTVEAKSGPGIAELNLQAVGFGIIPLTLGGYALVTEYDVDYHARLNVVANGRTLVPDQGIDMRRQFSTTATNTNGINSEVLAIQDSLTDDMVQAILFRLDAVGKRELAKPAAAPAASAAAPATASSTH